MSGLGAGQAIGTACFDTDCGGGAVLARTCRNGLSDLAASMLSFVRRGHAGHIAAVPVARRELLRCGAWQRIWDFRNRLREESNADVHPADPGNEPPDGMSTLYAASADAQAPEVRDRADPSLAANPHGECAPGPAIALRRRGPALEREG